MSWLKKAGKVFVDTVINPNRPSVYVSKGENVHVLFPGAKLEHIDLSGVSLSGVDLHGIDLRGANLEGVRFVDVDLSGADLTGANLTSAIISGVNLRGAKVNKTTMKDALLDKNAKEYFVSGMNPLAHGA